MGFIDIAATQSPTFPDRFHWKDLIVDREAGASSPRRLSDDDVAPRMAGSAMGEIREKNLIGGRP